LEQIKDHAFVCGLRRVLAVIGCWLCRAVQSWPGTSAMQPFNQKALGKDHEAGAKARETIAA
jgi:hypothetical protein